MTAKGQCPKCKEEIDYLFSYKIRSIKSKFKPGEKLKMFGGEIYREEFTCPTCSAILAYNILDAEKLLLPN